MPAKSPAMPPKNIPAGPSNPENNPAPPIVQRVAPRALKIVVPIAANAALPMGSLNTK